ncbi:MAG: class I mannose-6-phosphate isomerase [Acidaminococcaceae bacterium]|nr:class I mannose-6-phosphate isomerase [Acidaminococcaceae bacterium]
MNKNKPFLLKPAAKDYLWGGSRLNDDFGKEITINPLAETWECSTHPDGQSVVVSGEDAGKTLGEVLHLHPEYLGTHPLQTMNGKPELPILVKLIDAKRKLSVQVHPNDEYALTYENSLGKTEMWYVLSAGKEAELVYGFNQDVSEACVKHALAEGTIENYLNHVAVHKDDVFYIEAGTVHAIGAGVVLAEIQESSNLTYRLYDYERTDKNGKPRDLHMEKALRVMNKVSSAVPRQPMRVLKYAKGCAGELLMRCKYFQVERLLINTEIYRGLTEYKTESNSFHALLCIDGCGVLFGESFMLNFFKGDCVFIPANSIPLKLHGKAQFLDVSC